MACIGFWVTGSGFAVSCFCETDGFGLGPTVEG